MKPSQVAIALRRIAAGIQASKKPDRRLVVRDLKKIIAKVALLGLLKPYLLFTSVESIDDALNSVENHGDMSSDESMRMLTGEIDGLTGVDSEGN